MPDPVEFAWTSFDGLKLFAQDYRAAGSDERLPVVCLHGLTRNSRDFEELAPLLASQGRRVLVPDIRGRGRSEHSPDPRRYRPDVYAKDIAAMLDRAGVDRAVFIGTSMGGLIMMAMAARHSRRMAAAILNDVGPEVDPAGIARILSYAGKAAESSNWDEASAQARAINQTAFPDYGDADWAKVARRLFREENGRIVADYDPAITVALAKPPRFARPLAWLLFRRLARRRPTLLVRGALSDVITDQIAARMLRAAPRMEQAVIPQVGHAPTLAEPAALDAVTRFLARLP